MCGANLFHSFSQFAIPTGGSATFDLVNTPNISTIFSRVTGGNVSNIDGLIQTTNNNNPVSLFLLNPSGIIFGSNAKLNIGGSFIGTTANSIIFSDGMKFSASDRTSNPLLTIASPIGLNMESNSGAISILGSGHNLKINNSEATLILSDNRPNGFAVNPSQTLALVGGDILFDGGNVTALGGRVELGSVAAGNQVSLEPVSTGYKLGYTGAQTFQDIRFKRASSASANDGGGIWIQSRSLFLEDGSALLADSIGKASSQGVTVHATRSIELSGQSPEGIYSAILSQVLPKSVGVGGKMTLETPLLILKQGAAISSANAGSGQGGNIDIQSDHIVLEGVDASGFSSILSSYVVEGGSGQGGDINIETKQLDLRDGALILSIVLQSAGNAGNIAIQSKDSINMQGRALVGGAAITTAARSSAVTKDFSTGSSGNAGRISLTTGALSMTDGASISASIEGRGNANDIDIRVGDRLLMEQGSLIAASADGGGRPGNVTVSAGNLDVRSSTLTVSSQGDFPAGTLEVSAKTVNLDKGTISSSTTLGEGGNISLKAANSLVLRRGSKFDAEAGGTGNGGNITIASPVIVGLENSDIIANAVKGAGGNIDITTQGLLGLKSRSQLTPESDITASSQFGLSGTVNISNLTFTPAVGLIELPTNVDDPSQRIVQGCRTYGNSRFVATGRGGLPDDPSDRRNSTHPWSDLRDLSAFRKETNSTTVSQSETATPPIVEATGWRINAKGIVDIYAANNVGIAMTRTNCAGISTESLKRGNIQ